MEKPKICSATDTPIIVFNLLFDQSKDYTYLRASFSVLIFNLSMSYTLPSKSDNADGTQRKVGFELEFASVDIEKAAQIVQSLYGGTLKMEHRYEYHICDSELGDFRIELDARILRKMASQNIFQRLGIDLDEELIQKPIEEVVDRLAKVVVPLEIVMPPVPIRKLHRLEELRAKLQKNRAEGTHTSLVHAFGMHLNIESPDLQTETLLRYLKSFAVVYPWLMETLDIDISRRVSPFVDPFPDKYVSTILNPDYKPDADQLIKDYVEHNPTRNRPLDMMPIFGMINDELIKDVMEGEKNDPRPTFHYRLPNSRIDDSSWTFETEWNYWLVVERLAADDEMLRKLSQLYLTRRDKAVISFRKEWANTVKIMLDLDEQI